MLPLLQEVAAAAHQSGGVHPLSGTVAQWLWAVPLLPLLGNSTGWIMTEMGRQPWLVYGQMKTADGVSANSAGEVLTSLIVFTVLYGALAVIEVGLMLKYIRGGLTSEPPPTYGAPGATGTDEAGGAGEEAPATLVY